MSSVFDKQIFKNIQTRLGAATKLIGELHFKTSMRISGHFSGKILTEGFLYIERGAQIEADISVCDVVIDGIVRGDIEAQGMVEMLEDSQVYGNVRASKLRIADGVIFEGRCEMIEKSEHVDIFSMPINERRVEILKNINKQVDR